MEDCKSEKGGGREASVISILHRPPYLSRSRGSGGVPLDLPGSPAGPGSWNLR